MGLLGEVRDAQQGTRPGLPCVVERVRAGLEGQDAKDFEEALADSSIYATALTAVLKARGFDVARGAINRHRRGECGCPRG